MIMIDNCIYRLEDTFDQLSNLYGLDLRKFNFKMYSILFETDYNKFQKFSNNTIMIYNGPLVNYFTKIKVTFLFDIRDDINLYEIEYLIASELILNDYKVNYRKRITQNMIKIQIQMM